VRFGPVPLARAEGRILGHNVAGPDGRRALRKGRALTAADLETLRRLGRAVVYVAEIEPGDVGEDEAARRIAAAAAGPGLAAGNAVSGRVNLLAGRLGVLRVDVERLADWNRAEGITLATLPPNAAVPERQLVGTVKVIPYALPESVVAGIESAAAGGPVLRLDPLSPRRVALLLSGSAAAAGRIRSDFEGPLRSRVEALGSRIEWVDFVPLEDETGEGALAESLGRLRAGAADLILMAGETAIVDRHDIAPRAIERAGGSIEVFGAPVDPGNLLLIAYVGNMPVLGAPGCARSRKPNVVDGVLPRLLAGDRLTRDEVARLGAGGLLEDVPERPMPRAAR
jgi:molybdenum cofactor cytidylyltransferase